MGFKYFAAICSTENVSTNSLKYLCIYDNIDVECMPYRLSINLACKVMCCAMLLKGVFLKCLRPFFAQFSYDSFMFFLSVGIENVVFLPMFKKLLRQICLLCVKTVMPNGLAKKKEERYWAVGELLRASHYLINFLSATCECIVHRYVNAFNV